jgi:hypothetical protein
LTSSSSSNSDESDTESCFDAEHEQDETDSDTDLDDDVDRNDKADQPTLEWLAEAEDVNTEVDVQTDLAWMAGEENAHPPEYDLDQENSSDGSEDEDEDYSDGSLLLGIFEGLVQRCVLYFPFVCLIILLHCFSDSLYRYCKYVGKDPAQMMHVISRRTLKAFFEWILNQRQGKAGRRLAGDKSASTLGTYWKVFRLVRERATVEKIQGKINRQMHRVISSNPCLPA